ncbi:hypothetical protein BKA62DRAFT_670262 [Auriculariales sp. MPI-PUGE-AT-0066]|nr:hypothetical protein BKA62DRAFT_670262 [Auriculariales sp. MPI-PUGE-AT-0066]
MSGGQFLSVNFSFTTSLMFVFVAPATFELLTSDKHTLPFDLQPSALVTFSSARYDSERPARCDNTFIELADEREDILLHIAARRRDRIIAFNDNVGGRYGQEEIILLANVLSLENVTIEVMVQKTQFIINVNDVTVKLFHMRTEGAPHAFTYNLPAFVGSLQVIVFPTLLGHQNFRQGFVPLSHAVPEPAFMVQNNTKIGQLSQIEASAITFHDRVINTVEMQSMDGWGLYCSSAQGSVDKYPALKVLIEAAVKTIASKPHYF